MRNAPNKYTADKVHAKYGINNYLNKYLKVVDERHIKFITEGFLANMGFIGKDKVKQNYFIQNNFGAFVTFAQKYVQILPVFEPKTKKEIKDFKPLSDHNKIKAIEPIKVKKVSVRGPGIGIEGMRAYMKSKGIKLASEQ